MYNKCYVRYVHTCSSLPEHFKPSPLKASFVLNVITIDYACHTHLIQDIMLFTLFDQSFIID